MTANAPPLTPAQLAELRTDLESEIARAKRGQAGMAESSKPVQLDQTAVGRVSRIDAIQNQQMSKGLQERDDARFGALLAALKRLDDGTYGNCERCQNPIAYGRLIVYPETVTCAACSGR